MIKIRIPSGKKLQKAMSLRMLTLNMSINLSLTRKIKTQQKNICWYQQISQISCTTRRNKANTWNSRWSVRSQCGKGVAPVATRCGKLLLFGLRGTTEQHNLRWLSLFYQNEFFQSLVIAQITWVFFKKSNFNNFVWN